MKKLNTCDECGHYDWVHNNGKCGLDYCGCGKPQTSIGIQAEDGQERFNPNNNEETLLPEA